MRTNPIYWVVVLLLIAGGIATITRTYAHTGGGEVLRGGQNNPWYGESGDHSEWVPETEYKRNKYVGGGFLIACGAGAALLLVRRPRVQGL